jgi:predicted metalloprotease with PDZ domain
MTGSRADVDPRPRLSVRFRVEPDGLQVGWRLTGVDVGAGEVLARLPSSIAGAPTIELSEAGLAANDDLGRLALVAADHDDEEGIPVRDWTAQRASAGAITVDYLARPTKAEPLAATPPLELRRESGGLSGALKCFLVLPPGPEDLTFELRWESPSANADSSDWMVVTSGGEGSGESGDLTGRGLERLGDTYVMCGDLAERHLRDGEMSIWWLTPPEIDVVAFMDRLGETYRAMSKAFDVPAHPFRVFLRSHSHRGLNGSAHPASFVMAVNPEKPLDPSRIYETLAHELVHEWLRLDGSEEEVRWFNEGAADYYSLALPYRVGLIGEGAFLQAVNLEARTGYANPRRNLTMGEAEPLFFSDFYASWLPYTRGMFYLADLNARLSDATSGAGSVDDIVVEVTRRRRDGERVGIREWCAIIERSLPGDERRRLDSLVFTGDGRPLPGAFGPRFEMIQVQVPSLDLGFDPVTLIKGRVTGLVPGGLADRAGLREGDTVELPSFHEALALDVDDVMTIGVNRDGQTHHVTVQLDGHAVSIPQWRSTTAR